MQKGPTLHIFFRYDLILTAEERVYDQALEWFDSSGNVHGQPSHVVNMDIQGSEYSGVQFEMWAVIIVESTFAAPSSLE